MKGRETQSTQEAICSDGGHPILGLHIPNVHISACGATLGCTFVWPILPTVSYGWKGSEYFKGVASGSLRCS